MTVYAPKPVTLTQIDESAYDSPYAPKPLVVVGDIPNTGLVIPEPSETGTFVLTSTDGVLSWEVAGS